MPWACFNCILFKCNRLRKENADLREENLRLKARCGDIVAKDGLSLFIRIHSLFSSPLSSLLSLSPLLLFVLALYQVHPMSNSRFNFI